MKLISLYTESHRVFKDNWFLPSLKDDYEVDMSFCEEQGGAYMEESWRRAVAFKVETIIRGIRNNWGEIFVYSDVDIQFFQPTKALLLDAIEGQDIVCQRDDPYGYLCAGFWAARANQRVLRLWENIRNSLQDVWDDQKLMNQFLLMGRKGKLKYALKNLTGWCRYAYLPDTFYGGGTITGKHWVEGLDLPVPEGIVLHHANYVEGIGRKIAQLEYVKQVVESRLKNG
ncbi:MAG: putative nucleotide-diphospho-sugar transferase [Candidatus Omnitrophota bacterium]|jgi:hypothetical protein